jgi:hypothetical protein
MVDQDGERKPGDATTHPDATKAAEAKPVDAKTAEAEDGAKATAEPTDAKASEAKPAAEATDAKANAAKPAAKAADAKADAAKPADAKSEADEDEEEEEEEEDENENENESENEKGGRRGVAVEIEDSIEAQRATAVAEHQVLEKPASPSGAIVGGLAGAFLGAVVWWGLIRVTNYELGLVAVGVGVLAGLGVVRGGGRSPTNQIIGAACGMFGILLGRALFYYFGFDEAVAAELAKQQKISLDMARDVVKLAHEKGELSLSFFMKESFEVIQLVFYGIGMYEGYRIPRQLS